MSFSRGVWTGLSLEPGIISKWSASECRLAWAATQAAKAQAPAASKRRTRLLASELAVVESERTVDEVQGRRCEGDQHARQEEHVSELEQNALVAIHEPIESREKTNGPISSISSTKNT